MSLAILRLNVTEFVTVNSQSTQGNLVILSANRAIDSMRYFQEFDRVSLYIVLKYQPKSVKVAKR